MVALLLSSPPEIFVLHQLPDGGEKVFGPHPPVSQLQAATCGLYEGCGVEMIVGYWGDEKRYGTQDGIVNGIEAAMTNDGVDLLHKPRLRNIPLHKEIGGPLFQDRRV